MKNNKIRKNPICDDYLKITRRQLIAKFPKHSKNEEDIILLVQSLAFYGLDNTIKASRHKEADKAIDVFNLASISYKEDEEMIKKNRIV